MEKIVTETGKKKIKIKTIGDQLELTVDRGGWYEPRRMIELSPRQVQKLIVELQSVLDTKEIKLKWNCSEKMKLNMNKKNFVEWEIIKFY